MIATSFDTKSRTMNLFVQLYCKVIIGGSQVAMGWLSTTDEVALT